MKKHMQHVKFIVQVIFGLVAILVCSSALSCTTFAILGSNVASGNTLIAKNRDALSPYQHLAVRSEKNTIPYLGLFYSDKKSKPFPFITAGINKDGLAVVQNESVSIRNFQHFTNKDQSAVMYTILKHYSSVSAVIKDKDKLFANSNANFLIIADSKEAIMIEIANKNNQYEILNAADNHGILFHTNHYVLPSMLKFNQLYIPGSNARFKRMTALFKDSPKPFTSEHALNWLSDRKDGLYNGIFREFTLASWFVSLPKIHYPQVWVQLTSNPQAFALYHITLNPRFWKNPQKYIKPYKFKASEFEVQNISSKTPYAVDYNPLKDND
jgi:hypothetical protein